MGAVCCSLCPLPLLLLLLLLPMQDEMSIQLIVQEVPEQPKNLRINSQQSRSLQLTWSQPFAGNSPIEHYHIYYKQITGEMGNSCAMYFV